MTVSSTEPRGGPDIEPADARLVVAALRAMGLAAAGETPAFHRLAGGVSSDIWRVDLRGGPICVKRALPKLRVAADWRAPVERNRYEAVWMRRAAAALPAAVPRLLGQDAAAGLLAMAYLPPDRYRLWKRSLLDGQADASVAREVGSRLVRIHAATADDPAVEADLPTDRIFYDIRLEPYLVRAAEVHPDCARALRALVEVTAGTKRVMVHGDVSPKNILVGEEGPLFLDAECAWFGEPAFDLAFCLNHMLLKCLVRPHVAPAYLAAFDALAGAYLAGVTWEPPADLERRTARLLPGLFLARVDGKSPVEYVTDDASREKVRRVARPLLLDPPDRLGRVRDAWALEVSAWR